MRTFLLVLISLVALTAIPCGFMMMHTPDGSAMGLPLSILESTPFNNFFIPGLILTAIVGGVHFAAILFMMDNHPATYRITLTAGLIMIGWIVVQAILLMSFHWLHGLYLGIGILTMVSSYQLMGKAAF